MRVAFRVNGEERSVEASPLARLLDVLREDLRLTGTKEGCGEGECGACTVLLEGRAVNACLLPLAQVQGRSLTTVEGLAREGVPNDVQEALRLLGGTQCGICTPGIACCATAVLSEEPAPDRERIRALLAGNLCRCTGYQLVVDAVAEVVSRRSRAADDAAGGARA